MNDVIGAKVRDMKKKNNENKMKFFCEVRVNQKRT